MVGMEAHFSGKKEKKICNDISQNELSQNNAIFSQKYDLLSQNYDLVL